jgi:peptide/nickel transport system substrate-binding protein
METKIRRSDFLRLSAISALTTAVAACGGGAATPTTAPAAQAPAPAAAPVATQAPTATPAPAPAVSAPPTPTPAIQATSAAIATATEAKVNTSKFNEAPMLADLVKAGKLPPVDQRLPAKPYVIPHAWVKPGTYGGQLQMICTDPGDWGTGHYLAESMYGHSPLRWLKDGLAIGPGLAESWETNTDLSTWTFHFRQGLKWSDGQPWSVDDILFWWEDEVQTPELKETPPDEAHSGKGTLMQMKKVDDNTLQFIFDAPTPLTADRLAMWVNREIGPRWMDPKHYLQQFHPKYNPSVDKTKWTDDFIVKRNFAQNPDSPTMTGWMLTQYNKGQSSIWARNPYYWCVDSAGNQLPFIDGITFTNVQDAEVLKLRITNGQVDYVHGGHTPLSLGDVATLKAGEAKGNYSTFFWDSGSGTASMYFFNYDYFEPKMRELIRNPKFRQAMSYAYNRANAQKTVYFNTGELTTGTLSPKALEYNVEGGKEVFASWRDAYNKYDPTTANKMLDDLGLKKGADGFRTMPDGSPLLVTLDYPADQSPTGEHVKKNELLAADWKAVGINAKLNPVTPTSFGDLWAAGKILTTTAWEVGDGPNHLVYPQWLVPLENQRWAPLEGTFFNAIGTPQEKTEQNVDPYQRKPPRMDADPNGPIKKIWDLYNQTKIEPDVTKRTQLVWQMIKIHISDGPFFSGTVANYPQIVIARNDLMNVPRSDDLAQHGFVNPWVHPTPAVYDPEAYFWKNPDQHK